MRRRLTALALLAPLAACGAPDYTTRYDDPRDGRVYTAWSDCAFGGCFSDWKVCIGADLLVSIGGREHSVKDSPECVTPPEGGTDD